MKTEIQAETTEGELYVHKQSSGLYCIESFVGAYDGSNAVLTLDQLKTFAKQILALWTDEHTP